MNSTQAMVLNIAKEFSETPGPRDRSEGEFSGKQFLEELLKPRFEQARREGHILLVDLDGTEGYATSFLEAAFGGLAREVGQASVLKTLAFKSDGEPYLIEEIKKYISDVKA